MYYFPKKNEKGTLITIPEVKKKRKQKKKERTYLFVRSGTVRSALTVHPGSISKKKRMETLITFLEVTKKRKQKKKNELTFSFVQEPLVRVRPFVRAPFLRLVYALYLL